VQDGVIKSVVNCIKEDSPGVLPGVDAYSGWHLAAVAHWNLIGFENPLIVGNK
jgi:hypothetical protein